VARISGVIHVPDEDQRKVRSRLRRYERALQKEKNEHDFYRDGAGKRYQIGPHYMLLGDDEGALAAFEWFDKEFSDDAGKPEHLLCWSLALHRAGNEVGAAKKLRQAMLSNLYLVPHLLDSPIDELDIWHGSSDEEPSYVRCIPEAYLRLWKAVEREWASRLYHSPGFQSVRARYVEISRLLDTTPAGPERSRLVKEMYELKD
jgi:hypothetical protein